MSINNIFPVEENESFTDVMDEVSTGVKFGSKVILFNDVIHTFEQVVNQIIKATGYTEERAFYHTMNVHTKGKSEVYKGNTLDCINVSDVLREINLKTQVVS